MGRAQWQHYQEPSGNAQGIFRHCWSTLAAQMHMPGNTTQHKSADGCVQVFRAAMVGMS